MYSACSNAALPALGFPIRESADHRLFSAYPRLIAAVHALHRLLVPRHPPCALLILTVMTSSIARARLRARFAGLFGSRSSVKPLSGLGDTRLLAWLCSFQGPCERRVPGLGTGLSKLNSMRSHSGAANSRASTTAASARSGRRIGTGSSSGDTVCVVGLRRRSNPGASLERR